MNVRVYLPTTLPALAAHLEAGALPGSVERFTADGEDEESEYAALMAAADVSAGLLAGPGRRVVVVAEVSDPDGSVALDRVVAVHADPQARAAGADPDEDLAWYASQEIEHLLEDASGDQSGD